MTLQLEYSCTEKDVKEAKALCERESYGGGPKWRSTLVMLLVVAAAGVVTFLRFITEIAPKDRWWFIALVAVISTIFFYFKRKTREKTGETVRLEVSERAVVLTGENYRTELLWSGFSKCLETPNLFVLLNRAKTIVYPVPKRAFPDEKSQEWFRAQANQPRTLEPAAQETSAPGRFITSQGVALTLEYKFRDHVSRHTTSWRVKGMFLLIIAIFGGVSIYSLLNPPPDAVVPPWKVALFMAAAFVPMMSIVFSVLLGIWWLSQRKQFNTHHAVLTPEGIAFTERDSSGQLPWSTYKFYRETRWSFFVWNPQGSIWMMIPKRAFASASDLEQCRTFLQSNLKPSRWFYM